MGIQAAADVPNAVTIQDVHDLPTATFDRSEVDRLIRTRARCHDPRGLYNHLFHSEDRLDIARAKAICARCTVSDLCLLRALERSEPCGVWGGEILYEGEVVARPRLRGRRPKNESLVVDEITGRPYVPIADAV